MKTPQKYGEMYLAFDDGCPVYGFEFDWRSLLKITNFTDGALKQVVLPDFGPIGRLNGGLEGDEIQAMIELVNQKGREQECAKAISYNKYMPSYLEGSSKIMAGCFKGRGELEVVVPGDHTLQIKRSAFDDGAKIKFLLPQKMGLFQVLTDCRQSWALVAHDGLENIPEVYGGRATYRVVRYQDFYDRKNYGNFSVEHYDSDEIL